MFRRILEVFRLRSERRPCRLWYRRDLATIDTLQLSGPGLPALDLAKQPISATGPIALVPGALLAQDRAKRGLKTIRLVPMWPDADWLNSQPKPRPQASFDDTLKELIPATEHKLAAVKALHERRQRERK